MGRNGTAMLYTQGPYDLITISEVSDAKLANAFALPTVTQGKCGAPLCGHRSQLRSC